MVSHDVFRRPLTEFPGNAEFLIGFKVCTETNSTGYYIKYEGSPDGAVSDGCDAIALRVRS